MDTKIIRAYSNSQEELNAIKYAAEVIKRGGLVVFPTETVYGLGADATNENAVASIYAAKGRPSDNPLIIHISAPEEAESYSYTSPVYYRLAEHFMPGPLTIIMPSKDTVPLRTRGGLDTVAVRCPSNEIARMLISMAEVPIAAPSANLSGSPSPTSAQHVIDDMYGRVDVIIDGGDADFGLESTIVKIEEDSSLTLLRPGKITLSDLREVVENVKIASAVTEELQKGEVALSPGMKYKHYAPKSPLVLLDASAEDFKKYIIEQGVDNIAIIAYHNMLGLFDDISGAVVYDFGCEEDRETQAHTLFSILRSTDKHNFNVIYAPLPNTSGIGLAIYNRMIRAAAHKIIRLRR